MMRAMHDTLQEMYSRMRDHFGPTNWWPGDTRFEIAVGAILTQNTAWTNVERAIENLKAAGLLRPRRLVEAPLEDVEAAVRPSGYFRQKAHRVRLFSAHLLKHYGGSMARMAKRPLETLRPELLGLHGIGPETADDILLYALDKPVFVVDAYTRRILSRHGLVPSTIGYEDLRSVFEDHLEADIATWREYHGLIVFTGKDYCRSKPKCAGCPLECMLGPEGTQIT